MPVIGGWSHGLRAVRPSAVQRHIERQRAIAHLQAPPVLPVPVAPPVQVVTPVVQPVDTTPPVECVGQPEPSRVLPAVESPVTETKSAKRRRRRSKTPT